MTKFTEYIILIDYNWKIFNSDTLTFNIIYILW